MIFTVVLKLNLIFTNTEKGVPLFCQFNVDWYDSNVDWYDSNADWYDSNLPSTLQINFWAAFIMVSLSHSVSLRRILFLLP